MMFYIFEGFDGYGSCNVYKDHNVFVKVMYFWDFENFI